MPEEDEKQDGKHYKEYGTIYLNIQQDTVLTVV